MQQNILRSVINITNQRDVTSLESSLLATIPELLPVHAIALYKPVPETSFKEVTEMLRYQTQALASEPALLWQSNSTVLSTGAILKECLENSRIMEEPDCDGVSEIYLPITIEGKSLAALRVKSATLNSSQRFTLDALTKVYKNYLTILNESERDQLTSLLNRRTFDKSFNNFVASQKEFQVSYEDDPFHNEKRNPISSAQVYLAIIDIDFFKRVNDDYGHVYGDEILLLMAKLMRENFRSSDLLFRFGGEEFVVLLEPTSEQMALKVLERFRRKVETYNFPQVGNVTISIGYTEVNDRSQATDTIGRADQALYYSKDNGRNCTHSYEVLVDQRKLKNIAKVGSVELF